MDKIYAKDFSLNLPLKWVWQWIKYWKIVTISYDKNQKAWCHQITTYGVIKDHIFRPYPKQLIKYPIYLEKYHDN